MKPWLFVGAKVVCVDDAPHRGYCGARLVKGCVYTVDAVSPKAPEIAVGGLRADADAHITIGYSGELYWSVSRFRPVSTINTDSQIEAMRKLVRDAMSKQPASSSLVEWR